MRARAPDGTGFVQRDGVRVYYETYGAGERTIVFAPSDTLVTSEMWKGQVPFLARSYRVVVIDPRGNGRSDRPTDPDEYTDGQYVGDLIAVMDDLQIAHACLIGLCMSSHWSLAAAAAHPERVDAVVALAPWAVTRKQEDIEDATKHGQFEARFDKPYDGQPGWEMLNHELWLADWPRWPRFFFSEIVNDAHSSKIVEDLVGWACQSSGAAQAAALLAPYSAETPETVAELFGRVRCPVLVIQGTRDACQPFSRGADVARLVGGELLALGGAGHVPSGRDPVAVNHAIIDFIRRVASGTAVQDPTGPLRVRARLSTRRVPLGPPPAGTRCGSGWAYGEGPAAVVMLPVDDPDLAEAWHAQLSAVSTRLAVLVPDAAADGADAERNLRELTTAFAADQPVLVAPLSELERAVGLARAVPGVAAVLAFDSPRSLKEDAGLLDFFFDQAGATNPPSALVRGLAGPRTTDPGAAPPVVLVVDECTSPTDRSAVELLDAVVTVEGGGQAPTHSARRRRDPRVLYLSSPIGLGHARRDLAIAQALRRQRPGLRVDWLTQSPVTEFLERAGERVHPASAWLASESGHIESESGEHDLHAFQAIRRMDEILVNNFHVFDDLVRKHEYDAWVGDEAWDVDHFLHENPRLKRAPFVWMTDFVGWLPMPDGGDHEAALAADYNAEMVEHIVRYPSLRDRSVFVGDPDDVVPGLLGPGLPDIREWTEQHFDFAGYVMGGRPRVADRDRLRSSLGHRPDETVCVVSVGGSAVGGSLIRRVVDAYDACRAEVPSLRMHVVAGPRLDPASFSVPDGVTMHGFLPDLDLHHAACDIAIVQGGLSTTMELTAADRPFLYFPLRHHFEQQFHVRHRLERHGAGRAMDYASADPDTIASALVEELARTRDYVPVPDDGAERAAELVAEVI